MSRMVHRSITVGCLRDGQPLYFLDGETRHQVCEVLDRWVEMGEWWNGEGSRELWRVWTDQQGVFDIECVEGDWFIYRVWD